MEKLALREQVFWVTFLWKRTEEKIIFKIHPRTPGKPPQLPVLRHIYNELLNDYMIVQGLA